MSEGSMDFGRVMEPNAQEQQFGKGPVTAADKARQPVLKRPLSSTRREFLQNAAKVAVAGAVIAGGASTTDLEIKASEGIVSSFLHRLTGKTAHTEKGESADIPFAPPLPDNGQPSVPIGTPQPEIQKTPETPTYLEDLQNILGVAPFEEDGVTPNEARTAMEQAYTRNLAIIKNPEGTKLQDPENVSYTAYAEGLLRTHQEDVLLDQIDKGLAVVVSRVERTNLLSLRFKLRQEGHFEKLGITSLSQDKLQWTKDNDISPEMLAICLDNEKRTQDILGKLLTAGKLRDELTPEQQAQAASDPEQFMINSGGLSELFMQETHGFTFIGGAQALSQLAGGYYDERTTALPQLCELLNKTTGLHYETNKLPGSEKGGPENESGGAIGPQFMPGHALDTLNLIHDIAGVWLNPFDPSDAAVMSWVFLAQEQRVADGPNGFRYGYKKGDDQAIFNALKKWNNLPAEYNTIYEDAVDYYYKFLENLEASMESIETARQMARITQSDKRYGDHLKRAA